MKFEKLIFSIILATILSSVIAKIPKIQIYIESLCPDCEDFLTTSYKDFINRSDHYSLAETHIIPFGNASEEQDASGHYIYKCQHGPNECYGNLWEICGLEILTDLTGNNELGHKFTVCLEENIETSGRRFEAAARICLGEKLDYLNAVEACIHDPIKSAQLFHEYAVETNSLVPPHTYVPWIVVDGVHDVEAENQIISNMINYLTKGREEIRFLNFKNKIIGKCYKQK